MLVLKCFSYEEFIYQNTRTSAKDIYKPKYAYFRQHFAVAEKTEKDTLKII
jgi:hypothetical protein